MKGSWVDHFLDIHPGGSGSLSDELYLYITAFHWVMAQVTPAPSPVHPQNIGEQLFAIIVLFFGFALFSSLLGTIVGKVTALRQITMQQAKKSELLNKYMEDNDISYKLAHRISTYAKKHHMARRRLHWEDIEDLKTLPDQLRMRLRYEIYAPHLAMHPLFDKVEERHHSLNVEFCFLAMDGLTSILGEDLFCYGEDASKMTFIRSGTFRYEHGMENVVEGAELHHAPVTAGNWCSEAILWAPWQHRGTLVAVEDCEVTLLDSLRFRNLAERHAHAIVILRNYARLWAQRFQELHHDREATLGACDLCTEIGELRDLVKHVFEGREFAEHALSVFPSDMESSSSDEASHVTRCGTRCCGSKQKRTRSI